uniref:Amino acid permease/ SLC12A domain-containing protein n=2 Tax=Trichuris muris TaxID=70415 RepID=A0A5S6Q2A1_TRIMR
MSQYPNPEKTNRLKAAKMRELNTDDSDMAEEPVYMSPTMQKGDLKDDKRTKGALKPRISLFTGVMVIVGSIIGSGIFISPKGVHENVGSIGGSLIIWTFSGLFSAMGAYCYAELGTFILESGADYAYVRVAFGPFVAFIRLWIEAIIVRPCTMTVVAITCAVYILRPVYHSCGSPGHAPALLAAVILLLLMMINSQSVRWVMYVQNFFTIAKLTALALIIVTGIVLLCIGEPYVSNLSSPWEGATSDVGKISMALYSGLYAFNGWNYLNFITEELRDPLRDLPIAIGISLSLVTIVYLLTNVAFYAGLTTSELLESTAVGVTFGNRFYGSMSWIIPIFVACSCFGALNGILLTSSRLFLVAARQKQMPDLLSMVNPFRETPVPAVLFSGILSLLYLSLSDNVYTLINYVQIVNWLAIGCATAGLLYLRYKMPTDQHPRPLKVNLVFPVIFLIGCIFLIVVPLVQSPVDTLIGLGIMATSIPVYLVFIASKWKPKVLTKFSDDVSIFAQKAFLVMKHQEDID